MDLSEIRPLYRGMRCTAMGGACLATAMEDEGLFINPAGLAQNDKLSLHYAVVDADVAYSFYSNAQDFLSITGGLDMTIANRLLGKNVYARVTGAPMIFGPGFGLAALYDTQFGFYSQNLTLPQITMGYQTTTGIQAGGAISLLRGRKARGNPLRQPDIRLGFAAKLLWRRGGYYHLPVPLLFQLQEYASVLPLIVGNGSTAGIGFDFGVQGQMPVDANLTLMIGASVLDIGDTTFGTIANPQLNNIGVGAGLVYTHDKFKGVLEYAFRNIGGDWDSRKMHHVGLEAVFPYISFYSGFQEGGLTYGLGLDLWMFRVSATSYGAELSARVGDRSDRRYMARVDMKFEF